MTNYFSKIFDILTAQALFEGDPVPEVPSNRSDFLEKVDGSSTLQMEAEDFS